MDKHIFDQKLLKSSHDIDRKLLAEIAKKEDWVVTSTAVIDKFKNISKSIKRKGDALNIDEDKFIRVLANLPFDQCIMVLNDLSEKDARVVEILFERISNKSGDPFFDVVYERVITLHRISLIPKIFSEDRIRKLNNVINEVGGF